MKGTGCPLCSHTYKMSLDEVKEVIKNKYKGKYNSTNLKSYINCKTDIVLKCEIHGNFKTNIDKLKNTKGKNLHVGGCPRCNRSKLKTEDIIKDFVDIHGKRYDYTNFKYVKMKTKGLIYCLECSRNFKQTPCKHLKGQGCPYCLNSQKANNYFEDYFKIEFPHILLEREKKFKDLKSPKGRSLMYDFYFETNNKKFTIEINGLQHYETVKYFHKNLEDLEYQKQKDKLKLNYANANDIIHIVIDYSKANKSILKDYIKKLKTEIK